MLVVESYNLLLAGDNPGLDRCGTVFESLNSIGCNAHVFEQIQQCVSRGTRAGYAGEGHGHAEIAQVAGHVGRAARILGFAGDMHHRNRSLRGDARDLPPDESIQHEVAEHKNVEALKPRDELSCLTGVYIMPACHA